ALCRLSHGPQQIFGRGVVAKGFAHVAEQVHIPGAEHETSAELKGIPTETKLTVTLAAGPCASLGVGPAKNVEQIGGAKPRGPIRLPLLINQQRELNARLLAKLACVVAVPETHCCEACPCCTKRFLVLAQLRDMLATKY